jgi:hypothetical protein
MIGTVAIIMPRVAYLRSPGLDGGQTLTDDEARALAEALRMPKLRRLDLTMNRLSRATVETLLRAPWMQRLDVFDVEDPPGNFYCTERTGGGDDP